MSLSGLILFAQSQPPLEFEAVSIKPSAGIPGTAGMRRSPDGGLTMTNLPMLGLILTASPEPVLLTNVVGMPDWMTRERYDVIVKPPAGTTPDQTKAMWATMFADRLKLSAHVEHREQTTFALVLARPDGRLGPQLKPSALDCSGNGVFGSTRRLDPDQTCGLSMNGNVIVSGGVTLDAFARQGSSGLAGGQVTNRTGLEGPYALRLEFSPPPRGAADPTDRAPLTETPDFFTALQEQLGLKLQREKGVVPFFVIDHIERPTPN